MIRVFGYLLTTEGFEIYLIFYAHDREDLNKQITDYVKHYNKDKSRKGKIKKRTSGGYLYVCDPRGQKGNVD